MIRVLQVYPQMNNAGTERVIFNFYENIDTEQVQFDFLVERHGELDEKILNMGGKIYYLSEKKDKTYYTALLKFFSEHPQYKIVHTHTHKRMGLVLRAAQESGVPCRIAHSHNARTDLPRIGAFIKGLSSIPVEKAATHYFACSSKAAQWLFPHRTKECKIVYNGIFLENYLFRAQYRQKIRSSLGILDDAFVMIHVGRFAKQKNHQYLVKILEHYSKIDLSQWKMILVGEGPLQDSIQTLVRESGLTDHVIFLGSRTDVNELYSAADMFVFPSLHEGLGIVVVEAQASGLPCIVSNAVPPEADMGVNLLNTLNLRDSLEKWGQTIIAKKQDTVARDSQKDTILNGKYNIKRIAGQMQEFYLENGK